MPAPFIEAVLAGVLAAGAVLGVAAAMDNGGQRGEIIESVIKDRPGQRGSRARKARQVISGQLAAALVQRFNLARWLRLEGARERLVRAGKRSENAFAFYALRKLITPFVVGGITAFCLFGIDLIDWAVTVKLAVVLVAVVVGYRLPDRWLDTDIENRKKEILRAWPDALDLLVTLVEANTTPEQALQRVASEIDTRSTALAEELAITLSDLTYLDDRRRAFEQLGKRVDLDEVRLVCGAFIQADEQGAQLGRPLRTAAEQTRAQRLTDAERRGGIATTLLSMPTFIFFGLPTMALILVPSLIEYFNWR